MADLLGNGLARRRALALRRSILASLSLAVPLTACSLAGTSDDEAGVTTDPSDSNGNDGSEVDGDDGQTSDVTSDDNGDQMDTVDDGESEVTSDDGDDADDGIKFDVPPTDWPEQSCTSEWIPPEELEEGYPQCDLMQDPDWFLEFSEVCVPAPDAGCESICDEEGFCDGMWDCLWGDVQQICNLGEIDGECCAAVGMFSPPIGRPFFVGDQLRLASVSAAPKSVLAAHWLELAQGEHASVAAFARFIATLQRFAAPPSLLRDAIAASADEVRHTELALALASRFAGRSLALGALDVRGALDDADDLAAAVRSAVIEGCVDETLAAHEAACLAECAQDPQVAEALRTIAADEGRHATLAWRFVAWAMQRRPELRSVVAEAIAGALERPLPPLAVAGDERLLALGCPSQARRTQWRRVALEQLVRPCAEALLATPPTDARV